MWTSSQRRGPEGCNRVNLHITTDLSFTGKTMEVPSLIVDLCQVLTEIARKFCATQKLPLRPRPNSHPHGTRPQNIIADGARAPILQTRSCQPTTDADTPVDTNAQRKTFAPLPTSQPRSTPETSTHLGTCVSDCNVSFGESQQQSIHSLNADQTKAAAKETTLIQSQEFPAKTSSYRARFTATPVKRPWQDKITFTHMNATTVNAERATHTQGQQESPSYTPPLLRRPYP